MRTSSRIGPIVRAAAIMGVAAVVSVYPQPFLRAESDRSPPAPASGADRGLAIYYTASLNGNLDGCDCKGRPRSGLVKAGYFLSRRDRGSSLLIDAGDFLDPEPDKALVGYILDSFRELGYDAIGMGDQELVNGLAVLPPRSGEYALLCNNLRVRKGFGFQAFSPRPLLIEIQGIRVGLFCVIQPETAVLVDSSITRKLRIEDPLAVSAALEAELRSEGADLVVCVFHGALEAARQLAEAVSGIDVLLVGHEQRLVDAEKAGDTIIVSPGEDGNRVGVLDITVGDGRINDFRNRFVTFSYNASPDLPSIRERIEEYYKLLVGRIRSSGR